MGRNDTMGVREQAGCGDSVGRVREGVGREWTQQWGSEGGDGDGSRNGDG